MREPPPRQLTELLDRLGLASERDLASLEATVHRLAGDLPRFQSIWIDALRQARLLTHYQAGEIMAERGDGLRVGGFVVCDMVEACGYSTVYKAEEIRSREPYRLATFAAPPSVIADLEKLVALGKRLPQLAGLVESVGRDGSRSWAASRGVEGTSLAEWMLHHGRFPPDVVLEVAKAMLRDLAAMEAAGLVHGDIRIENVIVLSDGEICLPQPGLRGTVRPREGIAHGDIAPDACGTLAPERVLGGSPPTAASDLFACGCVWWQMLCGRPPLGGGDTMSRLRAAQSAAIDDYRQWAADVPALFGDAVTACLKKDPRQRPASFAALAKQLGAPRRGGRQILVNCLGAATRPHAPWLAAKKAKNKTKHPYAPTAAALLLLAALGIAWPLWVAANRPRATRGLVAQGDVAREKGGSPYKRPDAARSDGNYRATIPRDTRVIQAGYNEVASTPRAAGGISRNSDNVLELAANQSIRADALELKPGLTVRAQRGRCQVVAPRAGLAVLADRVTFENIDFVPEEPTAEAPDNAERESAFVRVECPECTFVGCSFQSAIGRPELCAGIAWEQGVASQSDTSLPSGRLRLRNCVFRRVAAGVVLKSRGANTLEIDNSLHLGPGPMIRLAHSPTADEPLRINMSQVTLRDADALVECRFVDGEAGAGEIDISASVCAFAPREESALLLLTCDELPKRMLREMKWTGQGSVVSPHVPFARWQQRNGTSKVLDDSAISISGLVRGQVQFAAPCDGNPASSRILECEAPLADSESLGANAAVIPPDLPFHNDHRR